MLDIKGKSVGDLKSEVMARHAELNRIILEALDALEATGGKACVKRINKTADVVEAGAQ